MRPFIRVFGIVGTCLLIPVTVLAQASIAGLVKDASGAILPGVTVEASSPALIEKVRTVVTDGAGQYRVIDLRPGTYSVRFTLPGFSTILRDGIELSGSFVATVNAEMRVGALAETITVTGEAPVVDVQNTRQQQVLDREVIRDLPSSRQYYSLAALIPGMVVSRQEQDVGGSQTISTADWQIHGGRAQDGRMLLDNLSIASARGDGANRSRYIANVGVLQETDISTSGGLGEAETAGVSINMIPREGSNSLHGSMFLGYANSSMQSTNFDDAIRATGLRAPNALKRVWEITPQAGGAIVRDRLWFFSGFRYQGTRNWIAGMYANKNANDSSKWTYEPDLNQRALDDGTWKSGSMRLTLQASSRNKVNVFWDEQDSKVGWIGGGNATTSREAFGRDFSNPNRVGQLSWSSPVTNRVLVEAGQGLHQLQWGRKDPVAGFDRSLIQVTEQAGSIPGIVYRSQGAWTSNWSGTYPTRASLSYVTGSHTSKFGFLHTRYTTDDWSVEGPNPLRYRFNNGIPNQVTLSGGPRNTKIQLTTMALFAQDSWVLGKLTLQGGVRYDRETQVFPEQVVGFTRFIPNGFVVPESKGVNWNDLTPRMAGSYSLGAEGKTALKVTLGKYVLAQDGGGTFGANLNPTARLAVNTVSRSWTDNNRDFIVDCNLLNPAAQSPASTGSVDACGPYSTLSFGQNVYVSNYDPTLIHGWGVRPYNWEFSASIQREVLPRVAVNAAYFRRWYGNFVVTDNRAVSPADFSSFSVTTPIDPKLPGGGGYTLDGFVNVNPAQFGLQDNYITKASNFGSMREQWQGVDLSANVRAAHGVTLQGGLSTGRSVIDECEVASKLPESFLGRTQNVVAFRTVGTAVSPQSYCHAQEPYLLQAKGLGAYTVPRLDVLVSATYRNSPGQLLEANLNASNALVAPSLGRPLSGAVSNVTINLVKPGTLYGDRLNQLDLRVAKVLRLGRSRTNLGIDLYNALNANPVTTYNQTYGPSYLTPTLIMPARFAKFSAQIDW